MVFSQDCPQEIIFLNFGEQVLPPLVISNNTWITLFKIDYLSSESVFFLSSFSIIITGSSKVNIFAFELSIKFCSI